jgi:hypothetical protein
MSSASPICMRIVSLMSHLATSLSQQ